MPRYGDYNSDEKIPVDYIEISDYKPWLTGNTPKGYWADDRNKLMALKWLFEEKLKWDYSDIREKMNNQVLTDNKLQGLKARLGKENDGKQHIYDLISLYSNGEIKPWELKRFSKNYFKDKQKQIDAVYWLFEQKLQWTDKEFKERRINKSLFIQNGFGALLDIYDDCFDIVRLVYRNRFKPWEIMQTLPETFWAEKENSKKVIFWFCTESNILLQDFIEHTTTADLVKAGLKGLVDYYRDINELKIRLFPEFGRYIINNLNE
ncbi:hypothetical protein CN918_28260 [Priestia megaterium]|nr:hypothetical protein CN918_28260 [Priestia megaterium]